MTDVLDPFTQRRLARWIDAFRASKGELPTRQELVSAGYTKDQIQAALKSKLLVELYVTLTNGTIVKVYKNSAP